MGKKRRSRQPGTGKPTTTATHTRPCKRRCEQTACGMDVKRWPTQSRWSDGSKQRVKRRSQRSAVRPVSPPGRGRERSGTTEGRGPRRTPALQSTQQPAARATDKYEENEWHCANAVGRRVEAGRQTEREQAMSKR